MKVRTVHVIVKPDYYARFEEVTAENHRASLAEPGVVRFDVLQDEHVPGTYMLYEMYRDDEAILAHKETDHYKRWRDAVEPMMEQPRRRLDFTLLYPAMDQS